MRFSEGHLILSHKEIYDVGEHIADCIYDSLLQFKNSERWSYPVDLTSRKEWEECLDKMLFSFKEISTQYKNDPWEIYFREKLKKGFYGIKIDDNSQLLDAVDDPSCTEEVEIRKKSEEYFDEIEEGINLFSKYYMDLWD